MLPILRNNFLPGFTDELFGKDMMKDLFDFKTVSGIPAVNITEGKENFTIEVAAPGLNKENFKINIENNLLTISSEKKNEKEDKEKNYVRREFSYSSFKRSFVLPDMVQSDGIKASHKDGILMVEIPKKEEAKEKPPREIQIS